MDVVYTKRGQHSTPCVVSTVKMSHVQCDCDVTRDLVSYVLSYGAPILATKTTLSLALNTVNSQAGPPMTESTA